MANTIGFIGLGLMGKPMALNLLKKGFPVVVHSRSRGPVDELVAAGATAADSPAEVARAAAKIVTMLPDGPDVSPGAGRRERHLQRDAARHGHSRFIDDCAGHGQAPGGRDRRTRRSVPGRARSAAARLARLPARWRSWSAVTPRPLETMRPVIEAMGSPEKLVHVGDSGAGQICKACNQIVLGGTMSVVAEAIALSRKAGVDPMKVRAALMGGFAQSRVLDVHGERMITGNWKPGFKAKFFKKDLGIALNTLAENGVPAATSAVVQQLVQAQIAAGEGEEDYSGLAKAIFKLANL